VGVTIKTTLNFCNFLIYSYEFQFKKIQEKVITSGGQLLFVDLIINPSPNLGMG
jgi:hypothetical protein